MNSQLLPLIMAASALTLNHSLVIGADPVVKDAPWSRHVIDDTSRGADGVRLADVNGDGLADIVTGWEEGGVTRVYLHPGHPKARDPWPAVTVGKTTAVEDAVFADLDGDGAVDVVSCCEGNTKSIFVHWAPKDPKRYTESTAWKSEVIPVTKGMTSWMFALPMQVDGQGGIDLIVGSKAANAVVGWLQSPADPRQLADWKFHKLYDAGWIMSLVAHDMNGDGRTDVVISDRKGKNSGVFWLEHPGNDKATSKWAEHRLGCAKREVMFLDVADVDGKGRIDVVAAVKPNEIHWLKRPAQLSDPWTSQLIKVEHALGMGTAKAVRVGDLNGDGKPDMAYTCEGAEGDKRGVVWLERSKSPTAPEWIVHDVSGPDGIKYDRIELLDLDGDGDLDILTCEERHNGKGLGVIWYENPFRHPAKPTTSDK